MRRHKIFFGFLFILSIIHVALAAPVLVQEKRQECADVVHIPQDKISVLGKRGGEEIEKMVEDLFGTSEKPAADPSDEHSSSSPGQGSMNDAKAQGPSNPASSPLLEPLNPTPISVVYPQSESDHELSHASDGEPLEPPSPASSPAHPNLLIKPLNPTPISVVYPQSESDHELSHASDGEPLEPASPPASSPAHPDPLMKSLNPPPISYASPKSESDDEWVYDSDGVPLVRLSSLKPVEFGSGHEMTGTHVFEPISISIQGARPSTDENFNWKYWTDLVNQPPKRPRPTDEGFDWALWTDIVNQPEPKRLKSLPSSSSSKGFGQGQLALVPHPNSDFNFDDYIGLDDLPPLEPSPSPKGFDQTHEDNHLQLVHVPQPILGPLSPGSSESILGQSSAGSSSAGPSTGLPPLSSYQSPEGLDNVLALPGPDSTDTGLHLDQQSSSTDSEPLDPEAARIYALKGKGKE